MQDYIDKMVELFDWFVDAPTGIQVVTGFGALLVVAAARNVWGVLYPVRWTLSKVLKGGAWVLQPSKKRDEEEKVKVEAKVKEEVPLPFIPFGAEDTNTIEPYTVKNCEYTPLTATEVTSQFIPCNNEPLVEKEPDPEPEITANKLTKSEFKVFKEEMRCNYKGKYKVYS